MSHCRCWGVCWFVGSLVSCRLPFQPHTAAAHPLPAHCTAPCRLRARGGACHWRSQAVVRGAVEVRECGWGQAVRCASSLGNGVGVCRAHPYSTATHSHPTSFPNTAHPPTHPPTHHAALYTTWCVPKACRPAPLRPAAAPWRPWSVQRQPGRLMPRVRRSCAFCWSTGGWWVDGLVG